MRVLVLIPHFFGSKANDFEGGSTSNSKSERGQTIDLCADARRGVFDELNLATFEYVIGLRDYSLVDIDIDMSNLIDDPRFLIYQTIDIAYRMTSGAAYDFVMIIEDDILISAATLGGLRDSLGALPNSDVVIPNRQETFEGTSFCVDLFALPGWRSDHVRDVHGYRLAEPVNTHCGMLFLDVDRFRFGYENRRMEGHECFFADYMESAFANVYSAFKVLRALPTHSALPVQHCDSWLARLDQRGGMGAETPLGRIASIRSDEEALQRRDIGGSS